MSVRNCLSKAEIFLGVATPQSGQCYRDDALEAIGRMKRGTASLVLSRDVMTNVDIVDNLRQ
jgi:hypothetical protein